MAQAAESPDGSADDEVARRTDGPLGGSADVTFVPVAARAPSVSTCGPFVSLGDGSDRSCRSATGDGAREADGDRRTSRRPGGDDCDSAERGEEQCGTADGSRAAEGEAAEGGAAGGAAEGELAAADSGEAQGGGEGGRSWWGRVTGGRLGKRRVSTEVSPPRGSSSLEAVFNGVNVLTGETRAGKFRAACALPRWRPASSACCSSRLLSPLLPHSHLPSPRAPGIGILTTPYALAQSGWFGLLLLAVTSLLYLLTARLLRACMDHAPATDPHTSTTASQTVTIPPDTSTTALHTSTITTYPDIGAAAFGRTGRVLTSLVLYGELFAVSVELLILEGDSLAFLFPSFAPHGVPLGSSLRLSANQSDSLAFLFPSFAPHGVHLGSSLRLSANQVSFDAPQKAFRRTGHILTSLLLYGELFVVSVEFLIPEGGSLAFLFPSFALHCLSLGPLLPPLRQPRVSDHRCAHRAPHGVITEDVSAGVCVRGRAACCAGHRGGSGLRLVLNRLNNSLSPSLHLSPNQVFLIIAALIVLPTVWLRKMSLLAYVSVGGLLAALVTVVGVAWVAAVGTDDAGSAAASASAATSAEAAAQGGAALLRVQGIPVAMGIFGFCFSGHAVFPTIYRSMDKPQHFNRVLLICFTVCTCIYGGIAILGYSMYGQATAAQITLNLPPALTPSSIVLWTTIISPITKFAITITPVALALESSLSSLLSNLSPPNLASCTPYCVPRFKHRGCSCNCKHTPLPLSWLSNFPGFKRVMVSSKTVVSLTVRTLLVMLAAAAGLLLPFFALVMTLTGSLLSISISLLLPTACHLSIKWRQLSRASVACHVAILLGGTAAAVTGTIYAVRGIAAGGGGSH
ncbi:unnamed protein product [Closterium sp. NIES-54]